MGAAVVGDALSLSSTAIQAASGAQAIGAGQISKSMAHGTKQEVALFSDSVVGGVAVAETVTLNSQQGNIVDGPTDKCLAISGKGGIVVKDPEGKIGVSRTVFSQGTNAEDIFVVGDSSRSDAAQVMGWKVDEVGNRIEPATGALLKNNNDLGQLVPVDFSDYKTFSEASTKVTVDNILNAQHTVNTATTAPADTDLQQTVTFYDSLGGKHTLTVSWRRILAGDGTNNQASDADSTRIVAAGTTYDDCDVWKMAVQYTDQAGAKQFAHYDDGADKALDFAATPRMFFKDGKLVGFAETADNTAIAITKMYDIQIPFTAAYGAATLDIGMTTAADGTGHSNLMEASTTAQLNGVANGSELVEMSDWLVDNRGLVQVLYPTKTRSVYQLPVGTFSSVDNVAADKGIWYPVAASGALQLNIAGVGAGAINVGKLELSTVETTKIMIDTLPLSQIIAASAKLISSEVENRKTIINAF